MKKMASLDNNNNCGQNKFPEIYPMEERHHRRLRLFRYHHQSNVRVNTLVWVRYLSRYINYNDGHWIGQFYSSFLHKQQFNTMNEIRRYRWHNIIAAIQRFVDKRRKSKWGPTWMTNIPKTLTTNAFHPNTVSTTEQRMCEPLTHRPGHWVQNPWLRYRCRENTIMTHLLPTSTTVDYRAADWSSYISELRNRCSDFLVRVKVPCQFMTA